MKQEQLQEYKRKIFYEILSWHLDEGNYQPTEEEANQRVIEILEEMSEKEYDRGCKDGESLGAYPYSE